MRLDGYDDEGAAVADACATALVAAGDRAPALLERLSGCGIEALLIASDDDVCDPRQLLVGQFRNALRDLQELFCKAGHAPFERNTTCPTPSPDSRSTRCWCTPPW